MDKVDASRMLDEALFQASCDRIRVAETEEAQIEVLHVYKDLRNKLDEIVQFIA